PDVLADTPRMVAGREPRVGSDLATIAVDLHPSRSDPDLVVPEDIGVESVPPTRMLPVAMLQHGWHHRCERPLEGDRHDLVGLTPEPHPLERLDHVVVHRADTEALGF